MRKENERRERDIVDGKNELLLQMCDEEKEEFRLSEGDRPQGRHRIVRLTDDHRRAARSWDDRINRGFRRSYPPQALAG